LSEEYNSFSKEAGELKFEFFTNNGFDSDKKFTVSVKNLLVLIKDFYGADSALVYWFNKNKKSFKLLASSEDNWKDVLNERFEIGNDPISCVCLKKVSEIINFESDQDKKLVSHYKGYFNIKSIIANPLLIDGDVVAVVLCESKTLNFFGTPNLYTLQVFSESITNYVKYYSLNEDFEYEDNILKLMAAGRLESEEYIYDLIEKSFTRYIEYDKLFLIHYEDRGFSLAKQFPSENGSVVYIEEGSLVMKSIQSGKIITHFFDRNESKEYRFFKNEGLRTGMFFCIIPVLIGNFCIGALAFETKENVFEMQKLLSKAYKLAFPQFLYLKNLESISHDHLDILDHLTGLYNNAFFETRLASEISSCRLFDDSFLYCVYISVDNPASQTATAAQKDFQDKAVADALKEKFLGYDMLFRIGLNKFAVILNMGSDEKVFLEFEKFRKYISTKIYNIEGKEISFTVSCAVKKYEDFNIMQEDFQKELDNMLLLAVSEGGNSVKI
jgi:diguanylate cyclase (GGDEF)-like protein